MGILLLRTSIPEQGGGGDPTYPNRPEGLTLIGSNDGSVRDAGGSAFGIDIFGDWNTDVAAPASNLEVVTDATNPTGSGSALRFVYEQAYNPRCADAAGTFASNYTTLYVMFRLYLEDSFNTKFFYVGLPSVAGSADCYNTREVDGRLRLINQNDGSVEVIDSSEAAPKGNSSTPLVTGEWLSIEHLFIAESSVGAGDGEFQAWINGTLVGSSTTATWNGAGFGSIEWYADANTVTGAPAYRLGELYMAGSV